MRRPSQTRKECLVSLETKIRPPGGFRDRWKINIPKEAVQNSIFSARDRFLTSKSIQKRGPRVPKIDQKSFLILEGPKLKNKQTLPHFSLFFGFKKDSKIVRKRVRKRSEIGTCLGPPFKIDMFSIFDELRSKMLPKGFRDRLQNRTEIVPNITNVWFQLFLSYIFKQDAHLEPFLVDFGSQSPCHTSQKLPKDGFQRATFSPNWPKPRKTKQNRANRSKTQQK